MGKGTKDGPALLHPVDEGHAQFHTGDGLWKGRNSTEEAHLAAAEPSGSELDLRRQRREGPGARKGAGRKPTTIMACCHSLRKMLSQ